LLSLASIIAGIAAAWIILSMKEDEPVDDWKDVCLTTLDWKSIRPDLMSAEAYAKKTS
jgi:hypothetical protein